MSTSNEQPLHKLVSALLDGKLSPDESEQLEGLLLGSAEHREEYRRQMLLHADLKWRHGTARPNSQDGGIDYRVMAELLEKAERVVGPHGVEADSAPRPATIVVSRSAVYAALATTVAGLLFATLWLWPGKGGLRSSAQEPVAVVADAVDLQWDDLTAPRNKNARLLAGEYTLVAGLVELEFLSGARIIVEAPAEFTLAAADRMRLKRGKVVGNVPPQAIGFSVETPTSTIIDLGTTFGVDTKLSQTHIEVFEGVVEVDQSEQIGITQHRVKLLGGHAARTVADVAGLERVSPGQLQFTRNLRGAAAGTDFTVSPDYVAAVKASKPTAYWRFETKKNERLPNELSSRFPLVERGPVPVILSPDDRDGRAVNHVGEFSGQSWLATPGIVEPFDESQFSIELWAYPKEYEHQTLVFLQPRRPNERDFGGYAIGAIALLKGNPALGPIRRVRFSHANPRTSDTEQSVYSAAPYQLDSWQHIVAVKNGLDQLLYVNGDLAGRGDAVADSRQPFRVVVGKLAPARGLERPFTGKIDEIALYDRALGKEEVRLHYRLGVGFAK